MSKIKVGLIGLIAEELKRDYWGTMAKVAAIGYRGLEQTGMAELLAGDRAANLKRLHELGLRVVTVGAKREDLQGDLDRLIADAMALQAAHITVWWSACGNREEVLRDAELYNRAGAKITAAGLKLCYHNHEQEFRNIFNGVYALDMLAEHTDPQCLYFNVDIAWVTFGGEDPCRVLRRLAGRVSVIHVKDLYDLSERGKFTAVGTGVVPVKEAVQTAIETGVEWAVIEQDKLRYLSALDTITVSYLNLKEAGLGL